MHANDPSIVSQKLSDDELCGALRQDLEAELSAINAYASRLEVTDNAEAKAILGHIIHQAREHAELFLQLIKRLNPEEREHLDEAPQRYCDIIARAFEEMSDRTGEPTEEDYVMPMHLSVGSLRR